MINSAAVSLPDLPSPLKKRRREVEKKRKRDEEKKRRREEEKKRNVYTVEGWDGGNG